METKNTEKKQVFTKKMTLRSPQCFLQLRLCFLDFDGEVDPLLGQGTVLNVDCLCICLQPHVLVMLSIDGHTDIHHDIIILYALYIVFLDHSFFILGLVGEIGCECDAVSFYCTSRSAI